MKLKRVRARNFRMLRDVELLLEDRTTVVVGRNNSGKTSLSTIVRRFVSSEGTFKLQDFSVECLDEFCDALKEYRADAEEIEVRKLLPKLELELAFEYMAKDPTLGNIADFIVDLDVDCFEAHVLMEFRLKDGMIDQFFEDVPPSLDDEADHAEFLQLVGDRIPSLFEISVWAVDPHDHNNRRSVTQNAVGRAVRADFINAQRGLGDGTKRDSDVLAGVLNRLFQAATSQALEPSERQLADRLQEAVRDVQTELDGDFRLHLDGLLPTLETLGYPGLGGPELTTETSLDVERLLQGHTKVRYKAYEGVLMPETYNGLGMRNLIFILLRIVSFHRTFWSEEKIPSTHVIFIEEPEAHLHPQMQEVFIRQLASMSDKLQRDQGIEDPWPVQFVVSTHSPHVANEAPFDAIRYFLPRPIPGQDLWKTEIKDLKRGAEEISEDDRKFLHQYLTLTRCDLFFADRAILIEGTTERILLPAMMDEERLESDGARALSRQYIAVMEVGGAYAHKFFDLLEFLELPALIITDLDPVKDSPGVSCLVHESEATSNPCLRDWFGGEEPPVPKELVVQEDPTLSRGYLRLAFQRPETESGPCGRTFEDAFILANPDKFGLNEGDPSELEEQASEKASTAKKSAFALKYAIDDLDWKIPGYIRDGLVWLRDFDGDGVARRAPSASLSGEVDG